MPEPTKLQKISTDYVSTQDELSRTFDRLRRLDLDDDKLQEAIDDHLAKVDAHDKARAALLKAGKLERKP